MRAVIQVIKSSRVTVGSRVIASVGPGLLVLVGVERTDTQRDAVELARKTMSLRIFHDQDGRMQDSVKTRGGQVLAVSQFTLLADCCGGARPSFKLAAEPELAAPLFEMFVEEVREAGVKCATGEFGAKMDVELVNEGPVTVVLDTQRAINRSVNNRRGDDESTESGTGQSRRTAPRGDRGDRPQRAGGKAGSG